MSHRYGTSGKTGDAVEKSIAAKIGPETEVRGHASRRPDVIGRSADVQREAWMDFDIHEDARTEGVALRRGPFSHVWMEGKEGGEKGDGYGKGGATEMAAGSHG